LLFGLLFVAVGIIAFVGNLDVGKLTWEGTGPLFALVGAIFFLVLGIDRSRRSKIED
jgi:hypothetical protein